MDNIEKSTSLEGTVVLRCFLILIALVFAAITVIEAGTVLHFNLARTLVCMGMWAGSAIWIVLALSTWWVVLFEKKGRSRNSQDPLWAEIACAFIMTAFAVCTQASIHRGILISTSLWANIAISVLMFAVMACWIIPKSWNPEPVGEIPGSAT